ncbi:MAG: MgtC/SapB family protein [Pyrinomonadaceae bacterium]|nr:MgtC/SapB family protein [Pyrinomonadaceae bacterium]
MLESDLNIFLRVGVSLVLSGILGWERESAGKAAGLRTHILVGVASTLFIVIGELMAVSFRSYGDHVRFDAANLIGAIVTGISFLGAGIIVFKRDKSEVRGLTTAAGILMTSAIGMLIGLERYVLAIGSTVIVFLVLRAVQYLEPSIAKAPESSRSSKDN